MSFKRSIDTSDPDIYNINFCVTVSSPLMNQQRRVSHFTPLPVEMILIKIDVEMPSADLMSGLVQIKKFQLHFVKSAQDQIKSFQLYYFHSGTFWIQNLILYIFKLCFVNPSWSHCPLLNNLSEQILKLFRS